MLNYSDFREVFVEFFRKAAETNTDVTLFDITFLSRENVLDEVEFFDGDIEDAALNMELNDDEINDFYDFYVKSKKGEKNAEIQDSGKSE